MMSAAIAPARVSVLDRLRRYRCIGWDLDDTLIGHPASPAMHDFIRTTPEITHLIITFRTAADSVWPDLARAAVALPPSCFKTVETMDPALAAGFLRLQRQRQLGLYAGPMAFCELEYRSWKGRTCARHGAELLIDDMTDHVSPGCERHGITLLHPDALHGEALA
jgi:hypothetical protein